jgi:membrane protein required for colicin V production
MIELSSLNVFDYAALVLLVTSGILATFRGMTREFMGIAGWFVAVLASRLMQPLIFDRTEDIIGNESATTLFSFSFPFVAFVILWFFFANIFSPSLKEITFGNLDRPLGFLFGVLRGFVLIALVYIGMLVLYDREDNIPRMVTESITIMPTRIIASGIAGFAPEDFKDDVLDSIPKQDVRSIGKKIAPSPDDVIRGGQEAIGNAGENASEALLPDEELIIPGTSQ